MIVGIIILAVLLILLLVVKVMKTRQMEQENMMMQSQMEAMEEFYQAIQNRIEATRRYRHDLAKHIQTLEILMEKYAQPEQLRECIEDMKSEYDSVRKDIYCHDDLVDSICSIKNDQCREEDIPLEIKISETFYSGIQELDMAALLHNLLDNAIEANLRIPKEEKRGIWFSMDREGDEVLLQVDNQIRGGEKVDFRTKKKQKEEHGIGMQIISSVVEKYHGKKTYTVDEEAGKMRVEIMLKAG